MKYKRNLATVLSVILLTTQSIRADESGLEKLNLTPAAHNGVLYVDKEEQKDLAAYIEVCEVAKKDLGDTTKAYNSCLGKLDGTLPWWQTPVGVGSVGVAGLLLGILVAGLGK